MLKILDKIPGHYPRAQIFCFLFWLGAMISMAIAAISMLAAWRLGIGAAFVLTGICATGLLGCVIWYFVELVTGRITPWRR
ncbi:hypothetical protein [Lysobacter sp. CA196]|uniref:hypothetical protein n=1 Tax=Lysobacter sp. CA196 TaxID=3455606 RepID=UPI003F8D28C6